MRLEWEDPNDPRGGQGGGGGKYVVATIVVMSILVLGAFGYVTLSSAQTVQPGGQPSGYSTNTGVVNGTTVTTVSGPVRFDALPPAPGVNGTSLTCQWAAASQRAITCTVRSAGGASLIVGLPILNPGPGARSTTLNYTAGNFWSASCKEQVGASPPYVAPGGSLTLPQGTTMVDCALVPAVPGSGQFTATVG